MDAIAALRRARRFLGQILWGIRIRPASFGVWAIAAGLAMAAACSSPKYVEDLSSPALVWIQANGLCSRIVAVDADRVVWFNQGCEDGRPTLDERRTVTSAELDDLWSKFDTLPTDTAASLGTCGGRMLDGFERWEAGRPTQQSFACGGTMYDDLSSLPDEFKPLAETLRSLE